jgi:hypothetical protein
VREDSHKTYEEQRRKEKKNTEARDEERREQDNTKTKSRGLHTFS